MDVGFVCCLLCRFQFQSPKLVHSVQASNGRVARELLAHPEAVHRLWTFKPAKPTYAKYWAPSTLKRKLNHSLGPCTQIIPTLGPKVCKYYLHWAIWIPRDFYSGLRVFHGASQGLRGGFTVWGLKALVVSCGLRVECLGLSIVDSGSTASSFSGLEKDALGIQSPINLECYVLGVGSQLVTF